MKSPIVAFFVGFFFCWLGYNEAGIVGLWLMVLTALLLSILDYFSEKVEDAK